MDEIKNILPVTFDNIQRISNQMTYSIIKIENENGKGTGFFCKILHEDKIIPVLITNKNIVSESILKNDKVIKGTTKDGNEKNIEILENKIIITNEKYDIIIIEINPGEDELSNFLDIDDTFINEVSNITNENIYIIHYPEIDNEQKACVSLGILKKNLVDNDIKYYCNTNLGSSGSPILRISNNKVIGIHIGSNQIFTPNIFKEVFNENLNINRNQNNSDNLLISNNNNEQNNNEVQNENNEQNDNDIYWGPETEMEEATYNPAEEKTIIGPETGKRRPSKNIISEFSDNTIYGPETNMGETIAKPKNQMQNMFLQKTLLGPETALPEEEEQSNKIDTFDGDYPQRTIIGPETLECQTPFFNNSNKKDMQILKFEHKNENKNDILPIQRIKKEFLAIQRNLSAMAPKLKRFNELMMHRRAFMRITLDDLEQAINENCPVSEYQDGESQWGTKKSQEF